MSLLLLLTVLWAGRITATPIQFTDVTAASGVGFRHSDGSFGKYYIVEYVSAGLDLFVSNYVKFSYEQSVVQTRMGHSVYPSPRSYEKDPDTLFLNNGDGDLDTVIVNSRQEPTLLRNDTENDHHWIDMQLQGRRTNRDGVGARVKVVAGNLVQVDEVHSGQGYQSHFGMRLHFGLGGQERIDRLEIRWVGGGTDVLEDLPVDRTITLVEGIAASEGNLR